MSPLHIGLAVGALTALSWLAGALRPASPHWLDLRWYFLPVYESFYGAVRAGAPMLWNPYQLCGMPWLGTMQAGFFYPPHVLYVLLPTHVALAASTVLHVALAAGATAAFARRAGLSAAGAVLAGALFVFGGPVRGWQFWPYFLEASAWLPVGALAVLEIADGATRRGVLLLACASGVSWLAGCPQATVLSGYAWGSLFVARVVAARPGAAALARGAIAFGAALVLGAALGAVALLPGLELAREGVRRMSDVAAVFLYPFGAPSAADVFAAWLSTGPSALLVAALALAPLALAGRARAVTLWALALAALAAGIAAGPASPLFGLYGALPLLAWFRLPPRVLLVGQLALALLAGLGLDAVATRLGRPWAPAAGVLALLAVAGVQGLRQPQPVPGPPYRADAIAWTHIHLDTYERLAADLADGGRAWPLGAGLQPLGAAPKLPTLARLRVLDDYEPLILRRQYEYLVYFREGATRQAVERTPFTGQIVSLAPPDGRPAPASRRRLLDLAAVRAVLVPRPSRLRPDVERFVRDAGLGAEVALDSHIQRFENPHALPRAFVTYRARPAPQPDDLLAILARDSFDPLAESFVEGAAAPAAPDAPARGAAATIVRDEPDVVEVQATLAAPGLVVLADTYYPGWTATVDGAPAPILATNHLFRGVPAPAGAHRVRFEYRPRSLWAGAALDALALAAVLALALGRDREVARA